MKKPIRIERLAYKAIAGETIILDTKIGKEVHQLNEVASYVWELCDGLHEVDEIIKKVCEEFEIDTENATNDIHALLNELNEKSLLTENTK